MDSTSFDRHGVCNFIHAGVIVGVKIARRTGGGRVIYLECFECQTLVPMEKSADLRCEFCGSINVQLVSAEALEARDLPDSAEEDR